MAVTVAMPFLFLFAAPLTGGSNDLVSWIDANDYFKSRQVEIKLEKMVELAAKKPEGSADSIGQLLAIRWLGRHPAEVKQSKAARQALEQIAAGKTAQDSLGFAKQYARRALGELAGKPLPLPVVSADSLGRDALSWFPESCNLVLANDARSTLTKPLLPHQEALKVVSGNLPADARREIYNLADTIGNVRVDRMSIAYRLTPAGDPDRIYIRLSGLVNREWLAKYLLVMGKGIARKEAKGPKGEPITLLDMGRTFPAVAIIGNTDLIIAAKADPNNDSLAVVQEMLEIRAGKQASITKSWADLLKNIPASASIMMVGKLNEKQIEKIAAGGALRSVPQGFAASVAIGEQAKLQFHGSFGSPESAKAFADQARELQQMGLAALKAPMFPLPPQRVKVLRTIMESLKLTTKGKSVEAGMQVAKLTEIAQGFLGELGMLMRLLGSESNPKTQPPPR